MSASYLRRTEHCAWCAQLKWPLAMVVDGESVLDAKLRMANIELINTLGVSKENLTACLECHCPGAAGFRVWSGTCQGRPQSSHV